MSELTERRPDIQISSFLVLAYRLQTPPAGGGVDTHLRASRSSASSEAAHRTPS